MARYELGGYRSCMNALTGQANREIDALLTPEVANQFASTDAYRDYLQLRMSQICEKYETGSAAAAATQYESWRAKVLGGSYRAEVPDYGLDPTGRYAYLTHQLKEWEKGNITEAEALEATRQRMRKTLDRRVKSAGRSTMLRNSRKDAKGVGCACVPTGATTCPFCLSMAAVGVAYSFAVLDVEGEGFHDNCDCVFVPGFLGHDVEVDGYSSKAFRDQLSEAMEALGIPQNTGYRQMTEAERYALRQELERRADDVELDRRRPDITLPKSVGAMWAADPVYVVYDFGDGKTALGEIGKLKEKTSIVEIEQIAGGRYGKINDIGRLVSRYGGVPGDWAKMKGHGFVEYPDGSYEFTELHWYERDGKRYEVRIKS